MGGIGDRLVSHTHQLDHALADAIRARRGAGLDSVLITQPYQSFPGPADVHLRAVREALHDEDGTFGLLWHRAVPVVLVQVGTTAAFTAALQAGATTASAGSGTLVRALGADESPMTWVEQLFGRWVLMSRP